jgi:hypothetical protein
MRTFSPTASSLLFAALLLASPARAQTPAGEPVQKDAVAASESPAAAPGPAAPGERGERSISDRQLGGHTFQPSHLLLDPFLVTAFGSHTGGLAGQALGPALDWSTRPPTVTQDSKWYNYSGLAQAFDVDVRFLGHYALRLTLGGGTYSGLGGGTGSALVVGTSVQMHADLFLKGSWAPTETIRVAATAGASTGPNFNILVLQGLLAAIEAGDVTAAQLLQDTTTTTWRGGASAAWSPARSLGFQGQVEYLYAVTSGAYSATQSGLKAALLAEFDFVPFVPWFPIAVTGTISLVSPLGTEGLTRSTNSGLGIWYSGRKDVALGLESIWQEGRLNSVLKTKNDTTWINLRYYW